MSGTIDLNLNTICQQRKKNILYSVPPQRFNPTNPYIEFPQYRKHDLDMRRKAEILKHNKSSTKTNNLTKSQKWSLIANGTGQKQSYSSTVLNQFDTSGNYTKIIVNYPDTYTVSLLPIGIDIYGNIVNIPIYNVVKGTLPENLECSIPKPTSSSDVPGPITDLYLDNKVPLYNYATNNRSYAIINPDLTTKWNTFTTIDILFNNKVNNKLCTLKIQNNIDEYAYTYTIQTPISLYLHGVLDDYYINSNNINVPNNTLSIDNISVIAYYNNSIVQFQKVPNITNVSSFSDVNFDISMNPIMTGSNTFTMQIYLGMLTISNLYLYTQPGYLYDIDLNFTIGSNMNAIYSSYFGPIYSSIICNTSYIQTINENCIINTPTYSPSSLPYTGFTFSGE